VTYIVGIKKYTREVGITLKGDTNVIDDTERTVGSGSSSGCDAGAAGLSGLFGLAWVLRKKMVSAFTNNKN
jgi:hypothetical protein